MPMIGENENLLDNFGLHEDEKLALEEPDVEEDNINSVKKRSDTESFARNILSRRIS